ncbi:hypothetical protein E2C01_081236 [Portunus trituberculatus]|uniref:Uncharacterized protein n=1 Tax=Portunus trituberculatus TaxID=210409 RepID=A0A5B7IP90_PORTR|nr:hypothetical protein [Portunus trituberculatus]
MTEAMHSTTLTTMPLTGRMRLPPDPSKTLCRRLSRTLG